MREEAADGSIRHQTWHDAGEYGYNNQEDIAAGSIDSVGSDHSALVSTKLLPSVYNFRILLDIGAQNVMSIVPGIALRVPERLSTHLIRCDYLGT